MEAKDYLVAAGLGAAGGFLQHQAKVNTREKTKKENERVEGLQQQKAMQLARYNQQLAVKKHGQAVELEGIKQAGVMAKTEMETGSKERIAGLSKTKAQSLSDDKRLTHLKSFREEWNNDISAQGQPETGSLWWKEDAVPPVEFNQWLSDKYPSEHKMIFGKGEPAAVVDSTDFAHIIGKNLRTKKTANQRKETEVPDYEPGEEKTSTVIKSATPQVMPPGPDILQPAPYKTKEKVVHSFGAIGEFATWVKEAAKELVNMSDTQKQKFKDKKKEDKRKYLRKTMSPALRKEFVSLSKAEQNKKLDEIILRNM